MFIRANGDQRYVFESIGRGIGAVARRNKLPPVAPASTMTVYRGERGSFRSRHAMAVLALFAWLAICSTPTQAQRIATGLLVQGTQVGKSLFEPGATAKGGNGEKHQPGSEAQVAARGPTLGHGRGRSAAGWNARCMIDPTFFLA